VRFIGLTCALKVRKGAEGESDVEAIVGWIKAGEQGLGVRALDRAQVPWISLHRCLQGMHHRVEVVCAAINTLSALAAGRLLARCMRKLILPFLPTEVRHVFIVSEVILVVKVS
jgi:hypothetical protein